MGKRIFSLILVLALVLTLAPAQAAAEGGPVIRCGDVSGYPGSWLSLEIQAEQLENLAALELWVYYDPQVLRLDSAYSGWLLDGAMTSINDAVSGAVSLSAAAADGISGDGTLMYLSFWVAEDCAPDRYPITLAVGDAYDTALSPVRVTAKNGHITVADRAPSYSSFPLELQLSQDTLFPGETVSATVCNGWYSGFASCDLAFIYDPTVFTLVSARPSEEIETGLYSLNTATPGLVRLTCANVHNLWCYEMLTVELQARADAIGAAGLCARIIDVFDESRIPYYPSEILRSVTVTPLSQEQHASLTMETGPLVAGEETEATLVLTEGSGLAAADFCLEYDSALLQCLSVEAAADSGLVVVNPNFSGGTIRFSFVEEAGATEKTPLVTIHWRPRAEAKSHYALKATLTDPVDAEFRPVTVDTPVMTGCIHRREVIEPTCETPGGERLRCVACGALIPVDPVAPLGHDYGEPEFRWAADHSTCTATRVCSRDSGHMWQVDCAVTHVSEGESCTKPGSVTYTATADFYGEVFTDTQTVHKDKLGHDYAWTVITEPGCENEGLRHGDCIRCDATCEEPMAPLGHDYLSQVTEPTCTGGGFTRHTCQRCGDSFTDSYTQPAGHRHQWTTLTAPTCTEPGREHGRCIACGDVQTREIPALGHDWDGLHCCRCGATRDNPFTDVPNGSFYFEPVLWAVKNGITNGTSATTFGPNDSCMRAHVVTFLWRAAGSPEPASGHNPFVDVKPADFYYKAVLWAVENGITNGLDATHFGPTSYCNRAQVVTFLHRALHNPEPTSSRNPFTDVPKNSFYYKPVLWAVENGVTNGLSATEFGPDAICNRAQIVTFLYRAFT